MKRGRAGVWCRILLGAAALGLSCGVALSVQDAYCEWVFLLLLLLTAYLWSPLWT